MEWVYNPPTNSPTLYEADPPAAPPPPFDLFAPAPPVEPTSETESEYYGDDLPDDRIAPEQAFQVFAQRTNFSEQLLPHPPVKPSHEPTKITFAETRQQRIRRIRLELAELRQDANDDDIQLQALQKELHEIEAKLLRPQSSSLKSLEVADGQREGVSEEAMVLAALEKRVFTLEQSVGTSHLSPQCRGRSVAALLDDVHMRLELISDTQFSERLKADAKEIAELLQREMQTDAGTNMVKVAQALEKMERWEEIAITVPAVVERLRCFKRLQREAAGFETELGRVKEGVEVVLKRMKSNEEVVQKVREGMQRNLETVNKNLNMLQAKLEKAKQTAA